MAYQILIVEDDAGINQLLSQILKASGYEVEQAFSGTEAKLLMERHFPSLILLDLMLPGMSGETLLEEIRAQNATHMRSSVPVIVISAQQDLNEKIKLLKMGADDYMTKPFEPLEVLARIEAHLRRMGSESLPNKPLTYKTLKCYPESRRITVNDQTLNLTAHEYDLLYLMIQNPQKVYSREALYELIWKGGYYGENNTVNVHVSNIRKKIKAITAEETYIETVYGIGFKLS